MRHWKVESRPSLLTPRPAADSEDSATCEGDFHYTIVHAFKSMVASTLGRRPRLYRSFVYV